jgi:enoyl-CoA hydratase/carnithine racemase
MDGHVAISRTGAVQIARLDRPEKKNALTGAMYDALTHALRTASADTTVAATLFLGGPGIFTAGNDLADFLAAGDGGDGPRHALDFLEALADCRSCLVAAVDGPAIGIGTTLAMHCDLVFASPRASFQTPFVSLGLVPEAGSSLLAPALMGHARAFELLVMGEAFTAERALMAGLINRIVPSETLEAVAIEAANSLGRKPREALLLSRQLLKGDAAAVKQRMRKEAELFADRLQSAEARAAFQAFLQKA